MVKTGSYLVERYAGFVLGFIVMILVIFTVKPVYCNYWGELFDKVFNFCIGSFGFLLTILAIIVQSESPTVNVMKSRKTLFDRFIGFNKRIVFLSLIICFYILFIQFFFNIFSLCYNAFIDNIIIGLFIGLSFWFVGDTLKFLYLFYKLIRT